MYHNVAIVTQTWLQNVTNVTRQRKSDDRNSYHLYVIICKYVVHLISVYSSIQNSITSQNLYSEVIQERVSCKVTNVTDRYITLFLTLTKNSIFKDQHVLTPQGSTLINQKLVHCMFAPGAVVVQKWNIPLFAQTWQAMGIYFSFFFQKRF